MGAPKPPNGSGSGRSSGVFKPARSTPQRLKMHGKGTNGTLLKRPLKPAGSAQSRRTSCLFSPLKAAFSGFYQLSSPNTRLNRPAAQQPDELPTKRGVKIGSLFLIRVSLGRPASHGKPSFGQNKSKLTNNPKNPPILNLDFTEDGSPIVDAGMRELWTTGWMHNRVRMIVANFLVKDLLLPWQDGARWFWDTLALTNSVVGGQRARNSARPPTQISSLWSLTCT